MIKSMLVIQSLLNTGGEHGVDGVGHRVGEIVAAHAVVVFEMADERLDGGVAFELAFDPVRGRSISGRRCKR